MVTAVAHKNVPEKSKSCILPETHTTAHFLQEINTISKKIIIKNLNVCFACVSQLYCYYNNGIRTHMGQMSSSAIYLPLYLPFGAVPHLIPEIGARFQIEK